MAWSAPITAVTNATLSAAQWNASVRDNLNETAPAKATVANRVIVTNGANTVREQSVALQSWTPTWSGLTVGNGTLSANWKLVAGLFCWRLRLVFGSTTAVSGPVLVTNLPHSLGVAGMAVGGGLLNDASASANRRVASCLLDSATAFAIFFDGGSVQSTQPFTWAVDDQISLHGCALAGTEWL